jgi:hypothetical protein
MVKFYTHQDGRKRLREAIATSTGVPDSDKIIKTNSLGKVDSSLLPYSWMWEGIRPSGGVNTSIDFLRLGNVALNVYPFVMPINAKLIMATASSFSNNASWSAQVLVSSGGTYALVASISIISQYTSSIYPNIQLNQGSLVRLRFIYQGNSVNYPSMQILLSA